MDQIMRKEGFLDDGGFILQRILEMTNGPEAFIATRSHFSRSLATLSIASYILGIGDRHMDNFLLSLRNGSLIGIDFGVAFGMGTGLPLPELIPFRMTPQFTQVLAPCEGKASVVRQAMVHALRALQSPNARELLLATLDVFIREPTIEWSTKSREIAERMATSNRTVADHEENASTMRLSDADELAPSLEDDADDAGHGAATTLPARRIHTVRRKLVGHNPAAVMEEEFRREEHFKIRRFSPDASEKIVECVWGTQDAQRRDPSVRETCRDAANQVELLCEMATDDNITTRQWLGLALWV
jgi:DNA-dependent protein kinase catalytic subunit